MMTLLLSGFQRITRFWQDDFVCPRHDEIALSLHGHVEEVFVENDDWGEPVFEIREVRRFRLSRRQAMRPYRVIGRSGRRIGHVRELVWQVA